MKSAFVLVAALFVGPVFSQTPFTPTPEELTDAYTRAATFGRRANNASRNLALTANWIEGEAKFWYAHDLASGGKEFVLVDSVSGTKTPAFDHARLAAALKADATRLPFSTFTYTSGLKAIRFSAEGDRYEANLATYALTKIEPEPRQERPRPRRDTSPDGKFTATIAQGKLLIKGENYEWALTKEGYASFSWSPDSKRLIAFTLIPGERKPVYLLKSSVPGTTRAVLETRLYDQPGDKLDTYLPEVLDVPTRTVKPVETDPIMGGAHPWPQAPSVQWWNGEAVLSFPIRGYQEHKVMAIDPATAGVSTLVHEKTATFLDVTKTMLDLLSDRPELIWRSERDGWSHLYRVNRKTGQVTQITKGNWVVRSLVSVRGDVITFTASGLNPAEDPYHVHFCRIKLDGTGFVDLTPADGNHSVSFSPDGQSYVDTYSRVDSPPVHELRRNGKLVTTLETSDISTLLANGVRLPERFVAKGRDGKTDIWGVVIKPSNFDPASKYPVIENIYAGPHDSFVPKAFRPTFGMHALAELGFIVVQIDGMGTSNRGKAFHDVCYKNIADAGFPDRILWMKALAKKMPQADVSRVGIYGTSAGGQNSAAGMLFHPEFYKVAVSACGCHDNRIDKQWWNEEWMGFPVGPHYDEQSNITNAAKLQGRLLLIVGELDRNVPPESTFRFADALIKANKDFDLVVIPGADHTDGGPYGEKKRRDFFVRWLHGVNPPAWKS